MSTVTIDGTACTYREALYANAEDPEVFNLIRDLLRRASLWGEATAAVDLGAGGQVTITVRYSHGPHA